MTSEHRLSEALAGRTVVAAVDRRFDELAAALERHGAHVEQAAALSTIPYADDDALRERTRELIDHPPQIVVVTTGIGFRGWLESADADGVGEQLRTALSRSRLLARGPKARGAIQQAGLRADFVAVSEQSAEIAEHLLTEDLSGRRVAVQHHGAGADGLDSMFTDAGADVVSLTVYRWGPPRDPEALEASIARAGRGEIDAIVFTAAPGAARWIQEAERLGCLADVREQVRRGRLLVAAVGTVTAAPLQEAGLTVLWPQRFRLGALIRAIVEHYQPRAAESAQGAGGYAC